MEKTKYLKAAAIVLLLATLLTVILQNREPVQTRFLFVTFEMPQILLLALTALAGVVVGVLLSAIRQRRRG